MKSKIVRLPDPDTVVVHQRFEDYSGGVGSHGITLRGMVSHFWKTSGNHPHCMYYEYVTFQMNGESYLLATDGAIPRFLSRSFISGTRKEWTEETEDAAHSSQQ